MDAPDCAAATAGSERAESLPGFGTFADGWAATELASPSQTMAAALLMHRIMEFPFPWFSHPYSNRGRSANQGFARLVACVFTVAGAAVAD
ncbi:hypothetical protein GALL_518370 [mine drainage metagenome]|uniref:Uncharacterized protein n=1 Tax=mine drainage metagenome TaxID=410659 RepID=A0A1J5P5W0_9ZZZZ